MISMVKTLPGSEFHMGALIREALTMAGISHRVGAGATERGWIATTGHEGPAVYITAHDCNGNMGYDVSRAGHIGINAVVTGEDGTRLVYNGTDGATRRPVADAVACAEAVAAYLASGENTPPPQGERFAYKGHPLVVFEHKAPAWMEEGSPVRYVVAYAADHESGRTYVSAGTFLVLSVDNLTDKEAAKDMAARAIDASERLAAAFATN